MLLNLFYLKIKIKYIFKPKKTERRKNQSDVLVTVFKVGTTDIRLITFLLSLFPSRWEKGLGLEVFIKGVTCIL